MTNEPQTDDDVKKDEVIYELVKRLYDEKLATKRVLDDKGSNLIGYITIVTGLLVGLGTFNVSDKLSLPQYYIPYFIGIGLLLGTIVFSMLSVRVKNYSYAPIVPDLRRVLNDDRWHYRTIVRQFVVVATKCIEQNDNRNNRKALWITISWWFLIGGLVFITIYVSIVVGIGKF